MWQNLHCIDNVTLQIGDQMMKVMKLAYTVVIRTQHKIRLKLMGMPWGSVLQVFDHKPKYWTSSNVDLMKTLNEKPN